MCECLKTPLLMLSLALGLLTGLVAAWLHGFYDGGLRYVIERGWF